MGETTVTLLGGTGFVGRALAARLASNGAVVRLVARRAGPDTASANIEPVAANVRDSAAMESALAGASGAVYLPGRVHGKKREDFSSLHVDAARACARIARGQGVSAFIYLSALGVERTAPAFSDQTKAEGEQAVAEVFSGAAIVRPSLVLGPGDHFSMSMVERMRRLPAMPVVGAETRVAPVWVEDLASGLETLLRREHAQGIYEFAGPQEATLMELLERIRTVAGARCRLIALPDPAAMLLAAVLERLSGSALAGTRSD